MPLVVKKRPNINRWVSKINYLSSKDKLELLANAVITAIKVRTRKGKDVNGHTFDKYTDNYIAWKSKHGGTKNGGKQTSPPNLTLNSHMLNSMTHDTYAGGVKIVFNSDDELKKAVHNQKTRPFFGLSKANRRMIFKLLQKEF